MGKDPNIIERTIKLGCIPYLLTSHKGSGLWKVKDPDGSNLGMIQTVTSGRYVITINDVPHNCGTIKRAVHRLVLNKLVTE